MAKDHSKKPSPTKPALPKPPKPAPKKPAEPPKAAAAFAAVAHELDDVRREDLATINMDIPQAVSIVLGVLPGLLALRPAMIAELPQHKVALLDRLESYALAAWYAHLLSLPESGPGNPVKPLLQEATALRTTLMGDAEALARRGLLDGDAVADIRAGHGNVDIANDLVALSALFSSSWADIAGRTAATEEEIRRAGDLGPLLLAALGVREHGAPPAAGDAADRRARAFTLFVRAYDQTQRAVHYLRWDEGDADQLAPSLYKGRGGRPTQARQPEAPNAAPAPGAPTESPGTPEDLAPDEGDGDIG